MKQSLGAKTLVFPTPVLIVGTYDGAGKPNIAAVAWGGICCSKPPAVAISLRAATYSHGCIVANQAFTVNIPSVSQVHEADYVGIYSGRSENKFEALGLTPVRSELVHAPYIQEFPLVLECKLIHTIEIGLHTQFIGEILDVKAEPAILDAEGRVSVKKLRPFSFSPSDHGYYEVSEFVAKGFSVGAKKQ